MKFFLSFFWTALVLFSCQSTKKMVAYKSFEDYPVYKGADLGMNIGAGDISFKVWSPAVEAVKINLYEKGSGGDPISSQEIKRSAKGSWQIKLPLANVGKYYTIQVKSGGKWLDETPDPYAKAVGVNGKRALICDLRKTDPDNWNQDKRPPLTGASDIILYELHVRDLSAHPNSGIRNKGKYMGLTEIGTRTKSGVSTGIDHLKSLGITHVHLLPVFDFRSIDESMQEGAPYNWGYDPENYNAPEGSYSTKPEDAAHRIKEFKKMVQVLHANGIRVVMDVVYNHTGATENSVFNRVAPGYYYRQNPDGSYANASACGNETASDRPMMRKFILESVKYWVNEYHVDGFRFDLMGIHDIETMNMVSAELHKIDPSIFIYGEGWTAGDSPLPVAKRALKAHVPQLKQVAAFSDDFRDALKGSVFDKNDRGFVSGKPGMEESIKFGIVAAINHPQIDYSKVNYSKAPWANEPLQTITYVECHDNHTLWDKLSLSTPESSEADRMKMHQLAMTMVLTAQGVPFIHAGMEFLRSKNGEENSFNLPDEINRIDWERKKQYDAVFKYYQSLIRLRKNHPAFRMPTAELIRKHLEFLPLSTPNLVAYQLKDHANGDAWKDILVIFNGNKEAQQVVVPGGDWKVVLENNTIKEEGFRNVEGGLVSVGSTSALILVR